MSWSISQVTRGMQLAGRGSLLAFENRHLYRHSYVQVFLVLLAFSLVLYILSETVFALPLLILRFFIRVVHLDRLKIFSDGYNSFITNWIFNLPFAGLLFMRYIYPQPLDSLFLESLRQIDVVYARKHAGEKDLRPEYATALEKYDLKIDYWGEMTAYIKRSLRQWRNALLIYMASLLPTVGQFVYPLASAYTLVNSLGVHLATIVGVMLYITPGTKDLAVLFLETLLASRALTREVLEPYFARIHFEPSVKRKWFKERGSILFGFSIVFYPLIRLPLAGMLFFGIAQAAAALLLVKTTRPPPPPDMEEKYVHDYEYKDPREQKKHSE